MIYVYKYIYRLKGWFRKFFKIQSQLQQARFVDGVQRIMTSDQKSNSRQVLKVVTDPFDSFSPFVYYKVIALKFNVLTGRSYF